MPFIAYDPDADLDSHEDEAKALAEKLASDFDKSYPDYSQYAPRLNKPLNAPAKPGTFDFLLLVGTILGTALFILCILAALLNNQNKHFFGIALVLFLVAEGIAR
jgi:hypothetical protein